MGGVCSLIYCDWEDIATEISKQDEEVKEYLKTEN